MTPRPGASFLAAALLTAALVASACSSSGSGAGGSSGPASPSSPPIPTTPAAPPTTATASAPAPSSPPATSSQSAEPQSFPLNGLQVADLSFVGDEGWALGTVGCVHGSGRCSALAHSTDGGRTWRSLATPPAHVAVPDVDPGSCARPCVQHVRFATARIGYLFGGGDTGAAYLTRDGGRSWQRQSAAVPALESLDGNVIRVRDRGGCPPGCTYVVQTAAIGGGHWTTVTLPGPAGRGDGVLLARSGAHAFLVDVGNPAGGANDETSVLWSSADDGAHWTNRGEPCPQSGGEADTAQLATAADGSVTVLCRLRAGSGTAFVATSTDGGAHFRTGARDALGAAPVTALGTATARTLLVSSDDTYRSTDGGRHFHRLSADSGDDPGVLGWLGFASATVGHAVSIDRRTIWVTDDAGRSWQSATLH